MPNVIKVLTGLETNRLGITPAIGRLLWVTDTKKLYVGDGSTAGGIEVTGGGGGGGLTVTYKTANYTLVSGDYVVINSAGTARIITCPASIAVGDRWMIHHFNTSGTTVVVTMARNGHTLRYKGTDVAADITLADGETVEIVCTSAANMEIV